MIIQRESSAGEFHVARDEPFLDDSLSWEARGVLAYLFTKPDDWTPRIYDLVENGPCKEHKIKTIFSELEDAGYLHRKKYRKDDGTFDWKVKIFDHPQSDPGWSSSTPDSVHPGRDRGYNNTDGQSDVHKDTSSNEDGDSAPPPARKDPPTEDAETETLDVSPTSEEGPRPTKQTIRAFIEGADSLGDKNYRAAVVFRDLFAEWQEPNEHISRLIREANRLVGEAPGNAPAIGKSESRVQIALAALHVYHERDDLTNRSDPGAKDDQPEAALNVISRKISGVVEEEEEEENFDADELLKKHGHE